MSDQDNQISTARERVALWVIIPAVIGILTVPAIAIWIGAVAKDNDHRNLVMNVFNSLIPLFGTWVGMVIAFHFSHENFTAAAKTTSELVARLGQCRSRPVPIQDVWMPVSAIDAITVETDQESAIEFSSVRAKLSGKVSRVPV